MIFSIIVILGCFFGYLIARLTKEELKKGLVYFKILELFILALLPFIFLYHSFNIFFFILGMLFGFVFRYEYFYFGVGFFSSFLNKDLNFLTSSLIFIYGLPYGSVLFFVKKFRMLFYNVVLFFIPFLIYYLNYDFLSFSAGGLLVLFFMNFYRLFNK
ncbi:hypothetical protein J4230_00590 [Candidatus Woesearchaeota archaeon]|nr:hypothetical protein [Candidatus Woesearchaeota archaeon]